MTEGALKGRNKKLDIRALIVSPFQGFIRLCYLVHPGLRYRSSLGYYVTPLQGWLHQDKLYNREVRLVSKSQDAYF
jgi:hypothetical protein